MYKRILEQTIKEKFFKGKIIIIVGPRQIGKTTLGLKLIKKEFPKKDLGSFVLK